MGGDKRGNMEETESMFTLTPMSRKLMLVPGEVYEGSITVINPQTATEPFSYKVEVTPYSVLDSDYAVDLVTKSNRSQMVDWITVDEPLGILKPNESKEIHYTIRVPETAPGGGQYAALTVGSDERDGSNADGLSIQNIYEMASVLYAQVSGDIQREGQVETNAIPGFVLQLPIKTSARIVNNGNIHETAKIEVNVKNFLNGAQVYPREEGENTVEEIIMPETERLVVQDISEVSPLGIYEVTQKIDYMGETSYNLQIVVACPLWFMFLILILIAVIGFGIGRLIYKHRKNKKVAI